MFIQSLIAFFVGGTICAICEVLLALTKLTPARILVGLVTVGIFLGAVGIYEPLLSFASTGVSVPLLGFGGVIAGGVREAVDTYGLIGILKGPLTAASAGIGSALFFGFLSSLFFRSHPKIMKK